MAELVPAPGVTSIPVGREVEAGRLDGFLASLGEGTRAVVIRGDAGIGKTTLWRWALERCRASGFRVLVTRPAEEEMPLPLVGLFDLFDEVESDPSVLHPDTDPFVRGRAVLETLRRLAEDAATVVAIDDLQWLDSVSAHALRFAPAARGCGTHRGARHGTRRR